MNGLIGKKAGMTHFFSEEGDQLPVTVLEMGPCPVSQVKTMDKDGYNAAQLAFEPFVKKERKKFSKPLRGHFEKGKLKPHRHLKEFRISENQEDAPKVGDVIKVDIFNDGGYVSVTGVSKGRGFAGVVKRHGYSTAPMSHGAHEQFRHPGSMGMCVQPGRVLPGKKLPGRMGFAKVKVLNLEIVKTFPEQNILLVKGAVPGPTGGIVVVEKTMRKIKREPQKPKDTKKKKK